MLAAGAVTVVAAAATAAPVSSAPARPAVELDVAFDPRAARVAGHARVQIRNAAAVPLADVVLWLYPNHLATRPPALGDVNFHWLYPGLFSAAAMEARDARVGGAPARLTIEDTPAGARTLARVALPAPLPPGAAATVDLEFETRIPRRFGAFGCDGARCRLMGGFYPTPAHLGPAGWQLDAPPDRTDARVTVRAPADVAVIAGGVRVDAGSPTADSRDVPYATIVSDRTFRMETLDVAGMRVRYRHRAPRPPSSADQPLPYVREDIPGLVLDTARRALEFLRDQGLADGQGRDPERVPLPPRSARASKAGPPPRAPRAVNLIEAP